MKTTKKIPKTFITFLIISSLIWLLITFSKEYTSVVTFAVNYTNIAQDKLLQETPIKEIDIAVKATGFKILRSKIRNKKINLDASRLKRKNNAKFYFLPRNQSLKIQKQLISGVELQEIIQDTIYLDLGILSSKKVALQPDLEINYHIGYDLLEEVSYQPDSIVISGPESQVKNINHLKLSKLILKDVKTDFSKEVKILNPLKSNNLKYKVKKATISGKVDKFTEGTLKVPFVIVNLPDNTNLTTLTESIEVVFVVALSNFSKVSASSFVIECDYALAEKNNLGYLIPKVISKPDFLKNIKITPTKIDFLIQK
ncbi:hypothetical protein BW723_15100 [Polaribacter reichenbachii]|uniref:YbbR-like domain-containing protein n=1 Tax=Polaribacter reichenbachii TaxID=996801 RepID=A0A1B8U4K6_9FLAO|nr:CdaR family protein [Polaribacter reichenbachii]APZ47531.1 hypothetical protein BW723_15100 [Polaribacter reichenbachii]AUC18170.1 hypothetical protein BTO17_05540 [Polaribacter reichenbachii]OBY66781.1 hypothetical protein LPB301_06170 [Polaribacter reichenbachii]